MKREDIKAIIAKHIDDEEKAKEMLDSIMAENGKDIEKYKSEVSDLKKEIEEYKGTMNDLNSKISQVNDLSDSNDTLQAQLAEWQDRYDKLVEKNRADVQDRKIREAFAEVNCSDVDFAIYKIGRENFVFNERNELIGFNETIEDFKKSHDNFFGNSQKLNDPDKLKDPELGDKKAFEDACKALGW